MSAGIVSLTTIPLLRADPLVIGDSRQLFLDHYLIEKMDNVRLQLAQPKRAEVSVKFDQPWENSVNYATVLKNGPLYQLYYRGIKPHKPGETDADDEVTCYAESPDGIHWTKPSLHLVAYESQTETNIILGANRELRISHNFGPWLDTKPGVPASEKYKAVGGVFYDNGALIPEKEKIRSGGGLCRLVSADGIHWNLLPGEALFKGYALDTLNCLAWLPAEQCYAIYLRVWSEGGDPYHPEFKGFRTIARSTSKDFVHWTEPVRMTFGDTPMEHLYTNATHPYFRAPQILIAMPFRFWPTRQAYPVAQQLAWGVDPGQANGVADAVLMTSRGGNAYDRTFMNSFLRPGLDAKAWHARDNSPARGVVPTGEGEMSFYAVTHYTMPDCFLLRYTLRTDGFASVHADYQEGTLTTREFIYPGLPLSVNFSTSAAGGFKVEVLGGKGEVVASSADIIGDAIDRPIVWASGDLAQLKGQPVRLRFSLKDADLYSLRFGGSE